MHESKALKYDEKIAKALQSEMDKSSFVGKVTTRPSMYTDCGENIFE